MWWAILGLALGIIIGIFSPFSIPIQYARYTAIAILAALDSILGAAKADLENKYSSQIFLTGLIFNMILAAGITYLGDKLGLDLYIAVVVAFTFRMLLNIGKIRRHLLKRFRKR